MIDMNLSNNKLITRAIKMLMSELNIDESLAKSLLDQHGSVRNALTNYSAQL
jgi:N-acetylmuramic acid 6-phosphate etherase